MGHIAIAFAQFTHIAAAFHWPVIQAVIISITIFIQLLTACDIADLGLELIVFAAAILQRFADTHAINGHIATVRAAATANTHGLVVHNFTAFRTHGFGHTIILAGYHIVVLAISSIKSERYRSTASANHASITIFVI